MNKIQQAYKALNGHFPDNMVEFHFKGKRIKRKDFIKLGERK